MSQPYSRLSQYWNTIQETLFPHVLALSAPIWAYFKRKRYGQKFLTHIHRNWSVKVEFQ